MKKKLSISFAVLFCLALLSCSSKKETASSIAQEWCDLNAKVYKAAEGPAKEAAQAAQEKFEKNMEEKYKDKKEFIDEVGKEVEKCEDKSEGK